MGWQVLTGFKMGGSTARTIPVTLSGTMQTRRRAQLCLTIRPHLIQNAEGWVAGAAVEAAFGTDQHAGMLRISLASGGAFRLQSAGWRAQRGTVSVLIPWRDGATPSKRAATPLSQEVASQPMRGVLMLRLPSWARPHVRERSGLELPVRAPAPVPPARSAYVSPSDRLPDPAAADRLAAKQGGEIRA